MERRPGGLIQTLDLKDTSAMEITVVQYQGRVQVALLRLAGKLDGASYLDLIARARKLYAAGARHMIVDLSDVTHLSSAGVIGLHQVVMLLRGETPPDPEAGWQAFHALADDLGSGIQPRIKLLNPQPRALETLERSGLTALIEIAADLDAAIASFAPSPAPAQPRSHQSRNRQSLYLRALQLAARVRRTTPTATPTPC
jgi:anti-anti-sigma regulatory factor